jgi:hypothetical protein
MLYDTACVENMWAYTMDELVDPSIGDEWYVIPQLEVCTSN